MRFGPSPVSKITPLFGRGFGCYACKFPKQRVRIRKNGAETIEYLNLPTRDERQGLCDQLRYRVFVVGCGAWQGAWKSNTRALGFSTGAATLPEPPSRQQILGSIDPELRLRFRDEIAVLPPMIPEDYAAVARKLVTKIPLHARPHWDKLIGKAIMEAAAGCLGMRMFEELVLKAMVLSRSEVPCQELE